MSNDVIRQELLSQLNYLAREEDALHTRRSLLTYILEQTVSEKDRIKRHLVAASRREEKGEGAA